MPTTDEHMEQISGEIDLQVAALTEQVDALRSLLGEFVTRKELQTTLLDSITGQLTTRLDEIDSAGEQRHNEFVRHYEQRLETLATKEEVSGIIAASAENAQRLTKLEATSETRLSALEKRADHTEEIQRKQTENIQAMSQNTSSIKDAVQAIERTYLESMERDKKRQADVDRELTSLKDAQAQDTKDIGAIRGQVSSLDSDVNGLRGDLGATVRPMHDTVYELKPQVANLTTRMVSAEKTLGYVERVASGLLWLFKTRAGNVVLAAIGAALFGFQLANFFLTLQFIQHLPH